MKKTARTLLVLSLLVLTACGGDDGGEENNNTGGSSGNSGNGSGGDSGNGSGGSGSGGTGGSGGSSVGTGGTGGTPAGPVPCGAMTCEQPAAGMGFITACCADMAMGTCGFSLGGMGCNTLPESDPRCPGIEVGGGMFEIASCCDEARNLCGIDASFLNMGCIDLQTAAEESMMGGMGLGELPQPRTCDGMLIDAGTGDDDGGV